MKVHKDKSTSANAAFWDSVEKIADEVRQWPAWKKGQTEQPREEHPTEAPEPKTQQNR
jgi:hypothetical protein